MSARSSEARRHRRDSGASASARARGGTSSDSRGRDAGQRAAQRTAVSRESRPGQSSRRVRRESGDAGTPAGGTTGAGAAGTEGTTSSDSPSRAPRLQRLVSKHIKAIRDKLHTPRAAHSPVDTSRARRAAGDAPLRRKRSAVDVRMGGGAGGGTKWEQCVVPVATQPLVLRLLLERRSVRDSDVGAIVAAVRKRAQQVVAAHQPWPPTRRVTLFVAAGVNRMTDTGAGELVAGLVALRGTVQVRVLRLHMNCIGDGGAAAVANLIVSSTHQLAEVHLSHNSITEAGVSLLVRAVAKRRGLVPGQPPPPPPSNEQPPLWLRLEYNLVDVPGALAVMHNAGISVCDASDRVRCSAGRCRHSPPPHMHLFCFRQQRRRIGQVLRGMLVDEASPARVLAPRKVRFASLPAPHVSRTRKEGHDAGRVDGGASDPDSDVCNAPSAFPMFVVPDAATLLHMTSGSSTPLTLERLVHHAPSLRGNTSLVLMETVLRHLDRLKRDDKSARGPANAFFSDSWQRKCEAVRRWCRHGCRRVYIGARKASAAAVPHASR